MNSLLSHGVDKTPRICIIGEAFTPLRFDATAIHTYKLAHMFSLRKLEVILIVRQTKPASLDSEHLGNLLVRRIPPAGQLKGKGWKALCPMLLFMVRLFYLLIKISNHYDIIIVCGSRIIPYPVKLASTILGKKWILRFENSVELNEEITLESLQEMYLSKSFIIPKVLRRIRIPLIKQADFLVAISSEIKQQLSEIGVNPAKVRSIPNCVDTDILCPVPANKKYDLRKRLSLPKNKIIFIFTGRLSKQKGLLYLIYAWNKLFKKYENIYLLLVGSGKGSFDSQEEEIRGFIRDNRLEHSVDITGEVNNVHEYLQSSDIYILPSEYEGFALSLVEALSCGLPTIATRVGGASELIQDRKNGVLVNPKDTEQLEKAMEWLLNNRDRWETMGSDARKRIVETYSIDAEAMQYFNMFKELLDIEEM